MPFNAPRLTNWQHGSGNVIDAIIALLKRESHNRQTVAGNSDQ